MNRVLENDPAGDATLQSADDSRAMHPASLQSMAEQNHAMHVSLQSVPEHFQPVRARMQHISENVCICHARLQSIRNCFRESFVYTNCMVERFKGDRRMSNISSLVT